jgi:hypothetical protein
MANDLTGKNRRPAARYRQTKTTKVTAINGLSEYLHALEEQIEQEDNRRQFQLSGV